MGGIHYSQIAITLVFAGQIGALSLIGLEVYHQRTILAEIRGLSFEVESLRSAQVPGGSDPGSVGPADTAEILRGPPSFSGDNGRRISVLIFALISTLVGL
jgi:hypothetical protein